jgi:hypothetical protein
VVSQSCSSAKLSARYNKDVELNDSNFDQLKGNYSNFTTDTIHRNRTLFSNFQTDTLYSKSAYTVEIIPIGNKMLELRLNRNDTLMSSIRINGKYRKGYFKVKRQWNSEFIVGPLVWLLGDNLKYVGLTKSDDLVILSSSGGVMLLIVFPIFAAGTQNENVYARKK